MGAKKAAASDVIAAIPIGIATFFKVLIYLFLLKIYSVLFFSSQPYHLLKFFAKE